MKFSIKDFFSKCEQIRRKLRIWSHLLKKSLMENFIFCVVHFCSNLISDIPLHSLHKFNQQMHLIYIELLPFQLLDNTLSPVFFPFSKESSFPLKQLTILSSPSTGKTISFYYDLVIASAVMSVPG